MQPTATDATDGLPRAWPTPRADQTRVLLLGTNHLDSPRIDDVLSTERQREFEALTACLADWTPDGVCVERSHRHQDHVDAVYEDYRSGERDYAEQTTFESPRMNMDDPEATCQSEVVQVGFRLADRLGHERVHAVDSMLAMETHLDRELDDDWFRDRLTEAAESLPDALFPEHPDHAERWRESTVHEFLGWLNHPERLRYNERAHAAAAFGGDTERYVGARLLTGWYERNLRIAENLWRAASETDADPLLLVVGSGHVHVLRGLLDDAPLLCPVSPLGLLDD